VEKGWVLLGLAEEKASLEQIFVRLTTREPAAEPGAPTSPAGAGAEAEPATPAEEEPA
jgi:hypothetical protein